MGLKEKLFSSESLTAIVLPGLSDEKATVRSLRGYERGRIVTAMHNLYMSSKSQSEDSDSIQAKLDSIAAYENLQVALYLGDENGKRVFGDDELTEVNNLNGDVKKAIIEGGQRLNGIGVQTAESLRRQADEVEKSEASTKNA